MRTFLKTGGLLIIAVLLAAAFAMPSAARYFVPQHWITGTVNDAQSGPTAEGRAVIVYFSDDPANFLQGTIGVGGAANQANKYLLNAFMIPGGITWEPEITVEALSPVALDTYAAGPVKVDTTGAGYDLAEEMTLESAGGTVRIFNVKFDGASYFAYAGTPNIIGQRPKLTAMMSVEEDGTVISSVELYLDGDPKASGTNESWWSPVVPVTFEHTFVSNIAQGDHTILIKAWSSSGVFGVKSLPVSVMGKGAPQVIGATLVYPSPFKPLQGGNAIFTYTLSVNADVTLLVYDISGKAVLTRKFSAGANGGRLGYNSYEWNGRTDFGSTVSNGLFVFKILSGGKQISKGKFVVLD